MSSCVTAPCLLIEGEMKAEKWKKNDPMVAMLRLSHTPLNHASLGLLTGGCVGALKVPVEVVDSTSFTQSKSTEVFIETKHCSGTLESYSLELHNERQ